MDRVACPHSQDITNMPPEPQDPRFSATTAATPFYVTGGTLPGDAASYVLRRADNALFAGLLAGEFCYVLDSRQMGKSSLMIRTAARLESEGITVIKLDLTAVGLDLSAEQWYFGLLEGLGCDLEAELEAFWEAHRPLGPLQRWFKAIEEVLLTHTDAPVVIFVDEIDIVRSLPFRTDEFFAGVRECYNRRASDANMKRLSFCLLGVTTPSDLIEDVAMTPFNIGTRIELNDFTAEEASLLGHGLGGRGRDGAELLRRVLYWTGGHPYLTQQLCRSVSDDEQVRSTADVDRVCAELFLSTRARKQDNNLLFVRTRLLQCGADVAGLLDLYRRVHSGRQIRDDETDPLVDHLRLSGIVRVIGGCLRVRNRIYFLVFDPDWVRASMPDAELRRQRAAYRRGVVRALVLSGAILALVLVFALFGLDQAHLARINAARADENARRNGSLALDLKLALEKAIDQKALADARAAEARQNVALANKRLAEINVARAAEAVAERNVLGQANLARWNADLANKRADDAHRLLYIANMNLVPISYEQNQIGRVKELLEETKASRFRNFEWGYWKRKCHLDDMTFAGHAAGVTSAAFSPDGRRVITGDQAGAAIVWDVQTGREILKLDAHARWVVSAVFSRDGKRIVTGSFDKTSKVWDALSGRLILTFRGHKNGIGSAAFSPDGKRVLTASSDKTAKVWDAETGRLILTLKGHTGPIRSAAFSPDGKRIVTGSYDSTARVWDARTGRALLTFRAHKAGVLSIVFSPDGRHIASAGRDEAARVWDARTGCLLLTLKGHAREITVVAYSPDGNRIVTGSLDHTTVVWEAQTGRQILTLDHGKYDITSAAFSPDGARIVTGSLDHTATVWSSMEAPTYSRKRLSGAHDPPPWELFASSYGSNEVLCYDGSTRRFLGALSARELVRPQGIAFGADENLYVTSNTNKVLRFDGRTGAFLGVFASGGGLDHPTGMIFGPDGNLYVGSYGNNQVLRYSGKTGAFLGQFVTSMSGGLSMPSGLTFGPDRNLYVCSYNSNQVLRYDGVSGAFLDVFAGGDMQGPNEAVFRPDGFLYVSAGSRVLRYDGRTGAFENVFASGGPLAGAVGLLFGPDGKVYVSGWSSFDIVRYDGRDGKYLDEYVKSWSNGFGPGQFMVTRLVHAGKSAALPPAGIGH